jgi:alpha-L-fucosidase
MRISRRTLLKQGAIAAAAQHARGLIATPFSNLAEGRTIASGPFQPEWGSLKRYKTPDWFRDAKFGIWAHWSAQCVPEAGDWYARQMYIQGHPQYDHHVKHYGHPSKTGFMEIDNLWKAEAWNPHELMQLYVNAGAKYFMSLANHHDNFDCYDSRFHAWNSTRIGPMRDIVGTWANLAREHGLRFGVSNHSAHSWHWFQTAYDYDPEGPSAGVRYDAFQLTKEDGKGKWWESLDPQGLYNGKSLVMPDGINSIGSANQWHEANDRIWNEHSPANNPAFVEKWFLRCKDLLDKYNPDMLYFDNYGLPLGQTGLDITAHFYNSNIHRNGSLEAVVFAKNLTPEHLGAAVLDIERGRADKILQDPWQTDTCIGDWHYDRAIYDRHGYKTAHLVVQQLIDIVSKNGNLLLNIPLRGSGAIDEDEHEFLVNLASWMQVNGEAIYGTRPFFVYGEGIPDVRSSSDFNESKARPFTSEDVRFTTKGEVLYAFVLSWPNSESFTIKSLTRGRPEYPRPVRLIELLGHDEPLEFTQNADGLTIRLPHTKPNPYAYAFRIR